MKRLMSASILCCSLGAVSHAVTIDFLGLDSNKGKAVTINYNGNSMNVGAGALKIKVDGGPVQLAYCVDLDHVISNGDSWEVTVSNSVPGLNGSLAQNLFGQYAAGVDSKDKGAALQLAIWDSIYDNGDGLTSGNFKASGLSSGLQATFDTYVATRALAPGQPYTYSFFEAVNHGTNGNRNQDIFTGEAVPEPGTIVLAAGALALAARRRKKA